MSPMGRVKAATAEYSTHCKEEVEEVLVVPGSGLVQVKVASAVAASLKHVLDFRAIQQDLV
jgi:hypothetical protein